MTVMLEHDVRAEIEHLCNLSMPLWESLPSEGVSRVDRAVLRELLIAISEHIDCLVARLDAPPAPLIERFPALDKWRRAVLEAPPGPLEHAAALEATALECEQLGAREEATLAMHQAWAVFGASTAREVA